MTNLCLQEFRSLCIPALTHALHKGDCGRIAIIGGSREYTGAPYFAAMASLKTGSDVVHLFCEESAAIVIKSYSPDLIVHPYLRDMNNIKHLAHEWDAGESERNDEKLGILSREMAEKIISWFPRFHAIALGCGLSHDRLLLMTAREIMLYARAHDIPMIIDADGLILLIEEPELFRIGPTPRNAWTLLTPNAVELVRLKNSVMKLNGTPFQQEQQQKQQSQKQQREMTSSSSSISADEVRDLAQCLGPNIIILAKGVHDIISDGALTLTCLEQGGARRCAGQGDLTVGILATMIAWVARHAQASHVTQNPYVSAAYAASCLSRKCSHLGYTRYGRGLITSNLLEIIPSAFESLFHGPDVLSSTTAPRNPS